MSMLHHSIGHMYVLTRACMFAGDGRAHAQPVKANMHATAIAHTRMQRDAVYDIFKHHPWQM